MIETQQADALSAALAAMFRALELRPLPDHLRRIVEQLDPREERPEPEAAPA